MSKPTVSRFNTIEQWRNITNEISNSIGDLGSVYITDAPNNTGVEYPNSSDNYSLPLADIITGTLNDLNSRKVKRSGDTITGHLNIKQNFNVEGITKLEGPVSLTPIAGAVVITSQTAGSMNNVVIGATTAAAGTFTSITASSFNGPIGGGAPSGGTFTSLFANSLASTTTDTNLTLSANGTGIVNVADDLTVNGLLTVNTGDIVLSSVGDTVQSITSGSANSTANLFTSADTTTVNIGSNADIYMGKVGLNTTITGGVKLPNIGTSGVATFGVNGAVSATAPNALSFTTGTLSLAGNFVVSTNGGTLAFSVTSKTLTVAQTLTLNGISGSTLFIGTGSAKSLTFDGYSGSTLIVGVGGVKSLTIDGYTGSRLNVGTVSAKTLTFDGYTGSTLIVGTTSAKSLTFDGFTGSKITVGTGSAKLLTFDGYTGSTLIVGAGSAKSLTIDGTTGKSLTLTTSLTTNTNDATLSFGSATTYTFPATAAGTVITHNASTAFTVKQTFATPSGAVASINLPSGTSTTTTNGDLWNVSGALTFYNGAAKTIAFLDSNITGTAAGITDAASLSIGANTNTTLNLGYTTAGTTSRTLNLLTAADTGGTKTINIGTAGSAGSTTNINLGSTVSTTTTIIGALKRNAPVTKTGDFTVAITEDRIVCNGTATINITMPAAATFTGREIIIKTIAAFTVVSVASNIVPINNTTAGTDILPATAGKWVTLVSDGTNWVIMAAG